MLFPLAQHPALEGILVIYFRGRLTGEWIGEILGRNRTIVDELVTLVECVSPGEGNSGNEQ